MPEDAEDPPIQAAPDKVTVEDLVRFSERCADLTDEAVMRQAWPPGQTAVVK